MLFLSTAKRAEQGRLSHSWENHLREEDGLRYLKKITESKFLFCPWRKGTAPKTDLVLKNNSR